MNGGARNKFVESRRDGYTLSDDPSRLNLAAIHDFLKHSYWSAGISREVMERAVANSLCVGLFNGGGEQVGFARVITDSATFAYLCDVYVLESHRGKGLGAWMIGFTLALPSLQGLRRIALVTRDAHKLYERHGFTPLARPQGHMEIHRANVYT
jgi:GNAT superfamily N-acetyltransferase